MPGIVSYTVKATKISKAYFLQGAPSLKKKGCHVKSFHGGMSKALSLNRQTKTITLITLVIKTFYCLGEELLLRIILLKGQEQLVYPVVFNYCFSFSTLKCLFHKKRKVSTYLPFVCQTLVCALPIQSHLIFITLLQLSIVFPFYRQEIRLKEVI